MFYAKLNEGLIFKKIIDCIKESITDLNLKISYKGIEMQSIDNQHIAIIYFNLPSKIFEIYKCDKILFLGISIDKLNSILINIEKDDSLILSYDNKLIIQYKNKSKLLFINLFIIILLYYYLYMII